MPEKFNTEAQKPFGRKAASDDKKRCMEITAVVLSYFILIIFFPIAIFFCVVCIAEYERVVVFRCGRLRKPGVRGPGVIFVLPCVDDIVRVDLRSNSFNISAQDVLTKDSVNISIEAVIYYHIDDPMKSVLQVVNARRAAESLAQTKLRTVVGSKILNDVLSSREELAKLIYFSLGDTTELWGTAIERVEIKDIKVPPYMQKALAQEAEAIRDAKLKLAFAKGEKEATKSLKAASDIMKQSPYTLQLRYMETLNIITKDKDSTIIFPVPVDIMPPGAIDSIILPPELLQSVASEYEAERDAKTRIAIANSEIESAMVLKEASDVMIGNPIALQLRYLQVIRAAAAEKNRTIVVPFPMDIMRMVGEVLGCKTTGKIESKPIEIPIEPITQEAPTYVELDLEPIPVMRDVSVQLTDHSDVSSN